MELDGDRKRLAHMSLALLEAPGIQIQAGQLRQCSALPPRHLRLTRQRSALADQGRALRSSPSSRAIAPSVPVVWARPHDVTRAPVNLVAGLDQLTRPFEVASKQHRADAEAVQEDRPTVLVVELFEECEALEPPLLGDVAGDLRRCSELP